MARTVCPTPSGVPGSRTTSALGVITKTFLSPASGRACQNTGKSSIRQRDLPAQVVVYTSSLWRCNMRSFLSRGIALFCWKQSQVACAIHGRCAGGWQSGNRLSP